MSQNLSKLSVHNKIESFWRKETGQGHRSRPSVFFGKLIFVLLTISSLLCLFNSCGSTRKASALAKCTFNLHSVDQIKLAGVDISELSDISSLSLLAAGPILAALSEPVVPLNMMVNIEGRNPNERDAGIQKLDWILTVDDVELTSGTIDQPIHIPGRGKAMLEVPVSVDLKKVLTGKSLGAVVNFTMNLAGNGSKPSVVEIKLKPVISVGGIPVKYPGYITVSAEADKLKY
jgi:LEA14-like dessication related protein